MMRKEKYNRIISIASVFAVLFSIFPALQGSAAAEFLEERVLDCHYEAPVGEGYAGYAVHVHNEDCYDSYYELCCPLPCIPPHVHSDDCYDAEGKLICGELEMHTHTEACYTDGVLTCGLPELQEHVHGEECFKTLILDVDPDTGEATVFSEPEADLETEEDWEASVADAELTGDWHKDLIAVARTQIGYAQSMTNIDWFDEFYGGHYTRYGDWYGYPYGACCAMFVSFCLHYAGIPEEAFPYESGTVNWVIELVRRGQFGKAGEYEPVPGDIVFFDFDDGKADHVGIVIDTEDGTLTTIEANHSPEVEIYEYPNYQYLTYILGYGILPENPDGGHEVPQREGEG